MKKMMTFVCVGLSVLSLSTAVHAESINEIYELAIQNDPKIAEAKNKLLATKELRKQANALLFPTIRGTGKYTKHDMTTTSGLTSGLSAVVPGLTIDPEQDYDSHGYVLTLSQPVYNHTVFVGKKLVDARVKSVMAEFNFAQQELMLRTTKAYFDILGAQDSLTFSKAEKEAISRQLEEAKQRFDVGLIAITAIHEAQARFDAVTASEILTENTLNKALVSLREITGQTHENLAKLGDKSVLVNPSSSIEDWVNTAMDQNQVLTATAFGVEAAKQDVRVKRAGHYPFLELKGTQVYDDAEGSSFGSPSKVKSRTLGLQLTVPIYSGGMVSSREREASHNYSQAKNKLEQVKRSVERQTREAYLNISASVSGVKALQQALVTAESALEATDLGFEVGTRTAVDVLNARRELFRVKRELSNARYGYILSTVALKLSVGTLSPEDIREIDGWLTSVN